MRVVTVPYFTETLLRSLPLVTRYSRQHWYLVYPSGMKKDMDEVLLKVRDLLAVASVPKVETVLEIELTIGHLLLNMKPYRPGFLYQRL